MPELSHEASSKYWSEYKDPVIYRVVTFMEGVEDWTLDGNPALEEAITALGRELDDLNKIDLQKLGHAELFVRLACNIKSSRSLRLLQSVDMAQPGSASRILGYAEENTESSKDPAGIFLRRNIVFERLRLLGRIFSEERFALVIKILEGEEI